MRAAAAGGSGPRHLQLPLPALADLAAVVRIARLLAADLTAVDGLTADLTADLAADLTAVDGLGRLLPLALGAGAVEHLPRPVQPQR